MNQDLIERVGRLEQENRRLRRLGWACLVIAAAVLLTGQAKPDGRSQVVIKARAFEVVDRKGNTVARLGILEEMEGKKVDIDVPELEIGRCLAESFHVNGGIPIAIGPDTAVTLRPWGISMESGKEEVLNLSGIPARKLKDSKRPRLDVTPSQIRMTDGNGNEVWRAP